MQGKQKWSGCSSFGQTILKVKFHFYKKQVINKSASVIFGFVRFIILSYTVAIDRKSISRGSRLSATQGLCLHGEVMDHPHNLLNSVQGQLWPDHL